MQADDKTKTTSDNNGRQDTANAICIILAVILVLDYHGSLIIKNENYTTISYAQPLKIFDIVAPRIPRRYRRQETGLYGSDVGA